ncbi:hypothetical protein PybrP1_006717 [[Pythium] brassicae (nom. inval.)]|nr:hypothetical protein PybrP1_006717 [[Pythium] brassicae (nom. inval.)]
MVGVKELDERVRTLLAALEEEEHDWREEQRKLFEFEDKFLRDTVGEGNLMLGWGESKSAPVRFRNAALRKRKRERQEAAGAEAPAAAELSAEEQLKVDRHRLASFSSVTSPAEPLREGLAAREQQLQKELARVKKLKK